MAISDTITSMRTNLSAAYGAIGSKGGTLPTNKNLANLKAAVETLGDKVKIGPWGRVLWVDNGALYGYGLQNSNDFSNLCTSNSTVTINGANIEKQKIISFDWGVQFPTAIPNNFLNGFPSLFQGSFSIFPDGVITIGNSVLTGCSAFNQPVVFPNSLTTIGSYVLRACASFNSDITFSTNLKTIKSHFLENCASFNKPINLPEGLTSVGGILVGCRTFNQPVAFPNSVTSLGDFLQNCPAFNSNITLPSNLQSLGSNFLYNCPSFNKPITLPSGLKTIAGDFMVNCASFNQSITLPSSLTSYGSRFMQNCTSFNKPLTLPSSITANTNGAFLSGATSFVGPLNIQTTVKPFGDTASLSTSDADSHLYKRGVTLTGPGAQVWKNTLPDSTTSPYRKLILG